MEKHDDVIVDAPSPGTSMAPVPSFVEPWSVQEQLPSWPIFETTVGTVLLVGALYYLVAQRGKLDKIQVEADQATGEAVIG